ncbi:hypothetical protein [Edwardsiella tarda]|uniref:hypothetical protein n=1 Tax=Edwardsiella tarda TaxID=636 RepID=UPI00351C80F1
MSRENKTESFGIRLTKQELEFIAKVQAEKSLKNRTETIQYMIKMAMIKGI